MGSVTVERSAAPVPQGSGAAALAEQLLDDMASVRRLVRRRGGRPAEFGALTDAQLELVRVVRRRPGVSVAQAAEELQLVPNTVSTLVRQLTRAGMLVRTSDRRDRRVARLELAPEARSVVGAWRDRRVSVLASAVAELGPEDRERLRGALAVLAHLERLLGATAGTEEPGDRTDEPRDREGRGEKGGSRR